MKVGRPSISTAIRLIAALGLCAMGAAQASGQTRPGDERPELPAFGAPPTPPRPPPPTTERSHPLSDGRDFQASAVRVVGGSVFTVEELRAVTSRYENRRLAAEDLLALRDELTQRYLARGYINSGAVIPEQEVVDGLVTVELVEGALTEIEVTGAKRLEVSYVRRRIALVAGPPFNVDALQARLNTMLDAPTIARLDARLGPAARRGEARLEVDLEEASPYWLRVGLDNHRSPDIGATGVELRGGAHTVLGYADPLAYELELSQGLRRISGDYRTPIAENDLSLTLHGERSSARIVSQPLDQLDIESDGWALEAGLAQPIVDSVGEDLTVGLTLTRRRSQTFLLGRRFSFSPGARDGSNDVTALRLSADWIGRGRDEVWAVRGTLSRGLDLLGATGARDDAPDSRFAALLGQAQVARRLNEANHQILLRVDGQLASDRLLAIEQFAIGGATTVRGYRENRLVRDNGVVGSIEYRWPLFKLPLPRAAEDGQVHLAPFFDIGRGWSDADASDAETIASVGAGLRWQAAPGLHAELYWGKALNRLDEPADDDRLQDNGFHFRLVVTAL